MAEYRSFFDSSGRVRIEVEGSGGSSSSYAGDLMGALQGVAETIASQMSGIPEEQRPTEMSVSFGLKALGGGGFAISLSEDQANFRVSMKWGEETNALLDNSMPIMG